MSDHSDVIDTDSLAKKVKELHLKSSDALLVYMQVSFTKNMLKDSEVSSHATNLKKLIKGSDSAQKAVLGGLERFLISGAGKKLLSKTSIILKELYEYDVLAEDVILKWGSKPSKKYVKKEQSKEIRKKAEPFLKWLEEEDE